MASPFLDYIRQRARSNGVNFHASGNPLQTGLSLLANAVPVAKTLNDASQYQIPDTRPNGPSYDTSGSTGGTTYDPNTDPTKVTSLQGDVHSKIQQLNDLYGQLYGDLNRYAADKRSNIDSQYNDQFKAADTGYQNALGTEASAMAARGLLDSSYLGDVQGQSKNTYTNDINNLNRSKTQNLADLGSAISGQQSQFQNSQNQINQINPNQYGTVNDLQSVLDNLNSSYGNLNTQRASLMTQGDLVNKLNAIAPAQSTSTADLSKQLQTLITSSAPQFAKQQLAQGLISRANLQDQGAQNYWTDYFQKLLSGQQQPIPGA